jgi:hypothetical protein
VSREVKIGNEQSFLLLSDEQDASSARSSFGAVWTFHARLVVPHLVAETRVHLTDPAIESSLPDWFADLSAPWRGWAGERVWATYEGGLRLSCTHDGLGHIQTHVRLREASLQAWSVEADIPLDAGQLDEVARAAAAFFG